MSATTIKLAERRKSFVAQALAARKEANASGSGYLLEDVREHYAARAAGRPTRKLRTKQWRG